VTSANYEAHYGIFLQSPVTSSLLGPNILLSPLLSKTVSVFVPYCERPSFTQFEDKKQNYSFVYFNLCIFKYQMEDRGFITAWQFPGLQTWNANTLSMPVVLEFLCYNFKDMLYFVYTYVSCICSSIVIDVKIPKARMKPNIGIVCAKSMYALH
jgi:hypothetical protein